MSTSAYVKTNPRPVSRPRPLSGIELVDLETFATVAQAGSFSDAARLLCVAQPTVTGRIQRLEGVLGLQLLSRTTRRVKITADGDVLLRDAGDALRGLREAISRVRESARRRQRKLVVAASPTLAAHVLPNVLRRHQQDAPEVDVELLDLEFTEALAAVEGGRADLAVLADPESDAYRFQVLWTDRMILVAPRGHALCGRATMLLDELAGQPIAVVETFQSTAKAISINLSARGLPQTSLKVVTNFSTLIGMLKAGMWCILLPSCSVQLGLVDEHCATEIEGLKLTRRFGIVTRRGRSLSKPAQAFCRTLSHSGLADLCSQAHSHP